MHDYKNIFIAWTSTTSSLLAAIETKTLLTIISAIVLPVIFFTIGKTVDVAVQVYFRRKSLPAKHAKGSETDDEFKN